MRSPKEAARLERLWSGRFGNEYTGRNAKAGEGRLPFWKEVFSLCDIRRILEVGCNVGANLRWIAALIPPEEVYGIDVNPKAIQYLKRALPDVHALAAKARKLPFSSGFFDMVFTTGVLIHQPPRMLPSIMSEIVRCSRRYVLCGEYFAEKPTAIPYRGQKRALFKRDFGALYQKLFPNLKRVKKGFLPKIETARVQRGSPEAASSHKGCGWDDVTYWIFEK